MKSLLHLLLILLISTPSYADEIFHPKTLTIHFPGGAEYLNMEKTIVALEEGKQFAEIKFSATPDLFKTYKMYSDQYHKDHLIFEIDLPYPDTIRYRPSPLEISEKTLSPEISGLMDLAAKQTLKIVQDFSQRHPDAEIDLYGVGISGEVILRMIRMNTFKIKSLIFNLPTMAMINAADFPTIFKDHGYDKHAVKFLVYKNDPTISRLKQLLAEDQFRFFIYSEPGGL